jgi:alkylation response protein AidB-like acyl-CoA dehydrogenase
MISERGYSGVMVPKEYGGLGIGVTGACIAGEGLLRMPVLDAYLLAACLVV